MTDEPNTIELLCQLTHASNLQRLCDLTCEITGNPVFISDLAHTILSYTKCVEVPDPTWQTNIVSARLERNTLRQDREVGTVHVQSTQAHRPVLVEDGYIPFPRIIQTLIHEGQAVGVMVLTAYLRPFGPHDREVVELIASFVVPCLMRERYHMSPDNRSIENYFIKLLDGERFTQKQVDERLDVLGYGEKEYTYVLALCARDGSDGYINSDLNEMLSDFSTLFRSRAFLYNSSLVCVYTGERAVSDWATQEPVLVELLDRWGLIAGVSRRVEGLARLKYYFLQARAILEMGRKLKRQNTCYAFDTMSSFLLFDRVPHEQLSEYCHQQIKELGDYDRAHGTELCATLQVYLEQAKSLARTADILFIHRNTVRYRVNRCMELLGTRLEDGNEIFAYILSLRILEYQSKLLPPGPEPVAGAEA